MCEKVDVQFSIRRATNVFFKYNGIKRSKLIIYWVKNEEISFKSKNKPSVSHIFTFKITLTKM